jgi:hypothetical protein
MFIQDPDFYLSRLPDPGVNETPDLGAGFAIMVATVLSKIRLI